MFARRFLFSTLITLLLVGLLAAGGFAIYRMGLSQGYVAGAIAAGKTGAQGQPNGIGFPWFAYGPFFGFPFFPPFFFVFALIALIWIFIFPLRLIARLISFWSWRVAGVPESEAWARSWHHYGRHMPPYWGGYPPTQADQNTQKEQANQSKDQAG